MGWTPPASSSDADAIHDNVAGEIDALGEVTPVAGDWALIEDTSDGDAKKKVDVGDFLSGGGSTWKDTAASSEGPGGTDDDEFDDSAITGWTALTVSGTATWTEDQDVLSVLFHSQSGGNSAAQLKAINGSPTAPIEIITAVRGLTIQNHTVVGIVFTDGVVSGSKSLLVRCNFSNSTIAVESGTLGNIVQNVLSVQTMQQPIGTWMYLKNTWTAANTWQGEFSPDGVTWSDFGFGTDTFTMTPTHYGLAVTSFDGGSDRIASFEFFRSDA